MLFRLNVVDSQNQIRKFSFQIEKLEFAFEVINQIVVSGSELVTVQLIDNESIIDLPVEAFDGDSSLEQIEALKRQWESILITSYSTATEFQTVLLQLANRQLLFNEKQIARIKPLMSRIEALLLHCHKMNISPEARKVLENNYQRILGLYRIQLEQAFLSQQRTLELISKLS